MNPTALLENLKARLQGLTASQKIFYGGSLLILLGSFVLLGYTVNRTEYAPLYSRLSEQDLGSVVETLKAKKIPYELSGAGGVGVPKEQLHEVRLLLATQGVVKGAGVGFEIFDQQKLGSTEFVQKINYQRALQGELARTINQINEVLESRVHLVLPSDSLFLDEKKAPSAAVVLKLRNGAHLDQQQVQGIVNLVASAVQGLQDDKVSILSTDGQVLFRKNALDNSFQLTNLQMQFRGSVEEDMRRKVQSLLEQVAGAGKVSTRITVDMDFNQTQVAEEHYDPDSAVIRSQQRSVENNQGAEPGAKGNPDVPINVEAQLMQSPANKGQKQEQDQAQHKNATRQRETVNYEINRVNKQTTQAPGGIKKVSVAVLVDGTYEMKPNAEGKSVSTFVARTPDQLKSLEDIVKKSIGYSEARGDQITVSNIPFVTDAPESDFIKAENHWVKLLKEHYKMILNLVIVVLGFFLIIRPLMRRFQQLAEAPKALPAAGAPALPASTEDQILGLEALPEKEITLRKRAVALVQRDPDLATAIIRAYLREEAPSA
jgi:flagellar M-ring protein FliF